MARSFSAEVRLWLGTSAGAGAMAEPVGQGAMTGVNRSKRAHPRAKSPNQRFEV